MPSSHDMEGFSRFIYCHQGELGNVRVSLCQTKMSALLTKSIYLLSVNWQNEISVIKSVVSHSYCPSSY